MIFPSAAFRDPADTLLARAGSSSRRLLLPDVRAKAAPGALN